MSFGEYCYISWAFTEIFTIWLLEYLRVIRNGEPQITIAELLDAPTLSRLIQLPVESVRIDEEQGVSRGAGGTGTSRAPLHVKLRNGEDLHLFAKTPTLSIVERAFFTVFQVYDNEVKFYAKHFKQLNAALRKDNWDIGPQVYHCKSYGRGKFVIILEDPRFRRPAPAIFKTTMDRPFSTSGAQSVLTLLANMHAHYWGQPPADIWQYCGKTGRSLGTTPPFLRFLAYSGLTKVETTYGQVLQVPREVRQAFLLALQDYDQLRAFWSSGRALTMCHGDAHMGNVFTTKSSSPEAETSTGLLPAGFIDFQCVAVEHCMRDVSYHLVNSCSAEELPALEETLIKQYLQALKEALVRRGKAQALVDVPDYAEAHFQYRLHAVWSLIAWVICCGFSGVVTADFAARSLQRAMDTCARLDILGALQEALRRQQQQPKK